MGAFLADDAAVYEETFVTLVGVTGDVDLCSSLKLFCGDGVRGSGCDGDGCPGSPAPLVPLSARLRRKTTQARPETSPESSRGWLEPGESGGARPARMHP